MGARSSDNDVDGAHRRPVLRVCSSCRSDESWDGESFFRALKQARRERGLKPMLKLKEVNCLGGCDTPCNAQLRAKGKPTLELTWLHGVADVDALLDGAVRYANAGGQPTHESLKLPGRCDANRAR
jgi:predicted metal-binding protein